ncbi:serologically defined colon cancer antigen 8 homolog isoform X4 [Drosophila ananassae]|uniref:serologically defined colon cancer antigen 8 homolog isoform X4 n=1 Tax=Drosophila ananassae TaxID=7217 RepID=UPI0013A5E11E|nr:serologically defined colon cancer antigen 8 homolog isoform X4 [Drosophila ananassae]
MKADNFLKYGAPLYNSKSVRSHSQSQPQGSHIGNIANLTSSSLLTSDDLRHLTQHRSAGYSDRESIASVSSAGGRIKRRSRNFPMKSSKGISKKSKTMDYTNYAYNEAVGRLKVMLADNTYVAPKLGGGTSSYLRNFNEDSGDNFSDNLSVIERPVFSDISKYLSPSQKSRITSYRPKKSYTSGYISSSKENLASNPVIYPSSSVPSAPLPADSVPAPVEIFSFIEKQEDYIEQLEKESKYCRNELTNLLGKVKDVINENEQLTENARSELVALGSGKSQPVVATTSPSSDSDEHLVYGSGRKTPTTPRKGGSKVVQVQSPRYASAPNIVYEARISELEAELMQASIDLRRLRTENEELKRKLSHTDPLSTVATLTGGANCDLHRKQLESLQQDKLNLEESVRHLQRLLDEAKAHSQGTASSKRYINDLVQMERSQAELEVRHLRDELDRQHERVRELQHEMARRLAEERASAERRYNSQVDQLGGDLSCQWEQVAKLQLDLERQKRYETDLKRDVASRNSQIEELKMELRANRTTFLADMAQVNAEKQSLEQEITSLRLQLDRAARETKTEAARLTAEINSLRQRLDRGDADLLHSKREVLRLNDEIANLEKELAYGELKNEVRPTKKDLDKRISELQDKHAETVNELEEMITSQKQLMDKLTGECKTLTGKLEDTTYKHKTNLRSCDANNNNSCSRNSNINKRTFDRSCPNNSNSVYNATNTNSNKRKRKRVHFAA